MSPSDPIDEACRSISDGDPVDWNLADTAADQTGDQASVRGLKELERVARFSRTLQRTGTAGPARSSRGVTPPEQWGHLTLLELMSSGTSGAIWRAWDTWLQREVALKFLLTGLGEDGFALIEEARALARARHPAIVAVYGIAEHDGRLGMWMELLVGSTLQAEIERRGPLPPHEVARIGLELCRALDAVEAAGLVHRDIKPANVIREASGRVVLTDFGLGRRRAVVSPELLRSSGTPLFMAPELLTGEPATPRSDLYALGVTLRWALTGRCPFRARTLEQLKEEVNAGPAVSLRAERPDAPPGLTAVIDRAMAKDADARPATASLMTADLETVVSETRAPAARPHRPWVLPAAAMGLLLAMTLLVWAWIATRPVSSHSAQFSVAAPPKTKLIADATEIALSPDGRYLAFEAADSTGTWRLWLRPLDSITARPLEGTEGAAEPFWSPDSRVLGFFAGLKLKKIAIAGGPPEILCDARDARGGTWGKNGTIVFAPVAAGSLYRVSAEGGLPVEIQRPDSTRRETALRWPQFLADGEHFLFVALPPRNGSFEVYAASARSTSRRRAMLAGCAPIRAGSKGIIFGDNGRLMFQRFDLRGLRPVGSPVALGAASSSDESVGQPLASASMNGVLAEPIQTLGPTRIVWLDRAGARTGTLPLPEGRYEKMYLDPTGRKLLVERRDSPTEVDLWMMDLARREVRRFTQGSQTRLGGRPAWSPDGTRIAFSSNREGRTNIYQRLANGAAAEELLFESNGQFKEVECWSPDGKYLLFGQADPLTGWDLWILPMEGKREPIPYLRTPFNEFGATISPDGRWVVYSTDATGSTQVYVRSFPKPGVEHLVSRQPSIALWSRRGNELILKRYDTGWMCSQSFATATGLRAGPLRPLFPVNPEALWLIPTPAGDRFLESVPLGEVEPPSILVDLDYPGRIGRSETR